MSLPSQSGGFGGRTMMSRRRRRKRVVGPRTLLFVLLVGGGAGLWWMVDGLRSGERDPGTEQPLAAVNGAPEQTTIPTGELMSDEPARENTAEIRQEETGPVVINLGAGGSGTTDRGTPRARGTTRSEPVVDRDTVIPTREMAAEQAPRTVPSDGDRDGWRGNGEVGRLVDRASSQRESGDLVAARATLNTALRLREATARDRAALRARIASINETLLFSPTIAADDPMVSQHVMGKEYLSNLTRSKKLGVDWRLLARVNGVKPERIRRGQPIKLVHGPFHAIVDKSAFRMDVWWGPADQPETWIYVRSFDVGLGEHGSTPNGLFKVSSRLENPGWTNPRTNERYDRNDPENPIGEHWIGLEGLGESAIHTSLGLHGTIEPESIGRNMSMGCVRLGDDDIALVFELLGGSGSLVRIVP